MCEIFFQLLNKLYKNFNNLLCIPALAVREEQGKGSAGFPDFGCLREVASPAHTRGARGPAWQDLKLGNMFWGSVLSVLCLQENSREAAGSPEDST